MHQAFKVQLILTLYKLVQKLGKEKTFYGARITVIINQKRATLEKKNYRPISLINIDTKIFNKTLAN